MCDFVRIRSLLLAAAVALACGAAGAKAAVLNLDFGPTPIGSNTANTLQSPYHVVTGNTTNTTWNTTLEKADVAGGLLYGDGMAATGVSFNLGITLIDDTSSVLGTQPSTSSVLGGVVGTGIYASPNAARDGIFTGSGSHLGISMQITGLAAGTYDIYYVGRNTNLGSGVPTSASYTSDTIYAGTSATPGDFAYLSYANPDTISYTSTNTATWVEGQNYARTSVTLGTGEYLNLAFIGDAAAPTDQRGFLNSLQLELMTPAPEPSTLALLGFGGLFLVRRRTVVR